MRAKLVKSVKDLVDELDGPKAAADFLGTTPQNVVHWRTAERIPARFYLSHQRKLAAKGLSAPEHLWSFREASAA